VDIEVTLKEIIRQRDDRIFGRVDVKSPKLRVYADSPEIRSGYGITCPVEVGKVDPRHNGDVEFLSHVRKWPQQAIDWIQKRVNEELGKTGKPSVPPSPIQQPETVDLDDEE